MNNKYLITIFASLFISLSAFAQEKLVSIGQNPSNMEFRHTLKSEILLILPFIDDFSDGGIYPDPLKWSDNHAYINNTYPIDQPSYGVATLDAIDSMGKIYEHAQITSYRADLLSSHPIDLNIGADTTVYLSFYYQGKGLGDEPEPGDSLVVEFYSPLSQTWDWAWSTPGESSNSFTQVLINVKGAAYLSTGFRFRFVNYASLANSYESSLKVNADHWHIDYVYLNQGRNYQDLVIPDMALLDPAGNLLLNYTAMPWEHFQTLGISAVKTLFPLHIQNLSSDRRHYTPLFKIEDIYGTGGGYEISLQPEEIKSFEKLFYDAPFNYSFNSDETDTASFLITLDLQPIEEDLIPGNTKLEIIQNFSNYYSYDDGSAETGYGLVGEGASNGRVAYRFENLITADSLLGFEMFFNKSFEDANYKYFNFAIWNEIEGKPGDLIYRMNSVRSGFDQGLTGFDFFRLDTAQIVPSAYYIGWIQVTNDFLNVGFDRNNNNQDNIFYTMDGVWRQTSFEGSLMMRPVFANKSKKTSVGNTPFNDIIENIKVYPNPASTFLNLDYPESWNNSVLRLIDIHGRTVFLENSLKHQLYLPNLDTGTYFLLLQNKDGRKYHHKLLITNE